MEMAFVHFTSSDTFLETDPKAAVEAKVEVTDYIEGSYELLRTGPNGEEIAYFVNGAWELDDGRRFSDWAVAVG
jgi:hypothetical protein